MAETLSSTEQIALPVEFTSTELACLAREMVMGIQYPEVILEHFNLTQAQFEAIQKNADYQRFVSQATIEWNSATSTAQRLKYQSLAALEVALPTLAARMNNKGEPLPAAVETAKLFTKMAGVGEQTSGGAPGEKFQITINLGGDEKIKIEKSVAPPALAHESDNQMIEVRTIEGSKEPATGQS